MFQNCNVIVIIVTTIYVSITGKNVFDSIIGTIDCVPENMKKVKWKKTLPIDSLNCSIFEILSVPNVHGSGNNSGAPFKRNNFFATRISRTHLANSPKYLPPIYFSNLYAET